MSGYAPHAAGSGGVGLCGAAALLFTALKLTGHVDWSWWWVLAPLWVPTALIGLVCTLFAGIYLVLLVADRRRTRHGHPRRGDHGPVTRWGPRR